MTNYNPTIAALVILIAIFVVYSITKSDVEHYSGTGALTQLHAKGPQDLYLTDDAKKYMYYDYYRSFPYVESVWNNPTKIGYNNNYYDRLRFFNYEYPLRTYSTYPTYPTYPTYYPHYLNRNYLFPFLWR